ncbi:MULTISPECIES: hypothetical protein [unclassified Bacillus (in: firmicutes)]|jgi:hypothetical protein|uniref:hypothetical protein n=1 Tax=unclassified Bacillus (in: firmicutes) TaxID=185979 RepID=UPI000A9A1294|nr:MULTISPECIES: hypothetical protein [unclassified Bacillus (in: firmicutes)]
MAKRTKKNDPQQKNKQGFDSSKKDTEFGKEFGSANANRAKKEKDKEQRAYTNQDA